MIWRDGRKWTWQCGHEQVLSYATDPMNTFQPFLDGYESEVRDERTQSFLLDYIEYLIESGIDRQLAYEELDKQQERWVREHELCYRMMDEGLALSMATPTPYLRNGCIYYA